MGFFSKSRKSEPENVIVNGNMLECRVCKSKEFTSREAQLNTAGMSMLDLDFLNKTATCFVCANCTHIEWFVEDPRNRYT
jgi:predicted nucleic-acid-binding Zn-ribbon protein